MELLGEQKAATEVWLQKDMFIDEIKMKDYIDALCSSISWRHSDERQKSNHNLRGFSVLLMQFGNYII